MPVEILSSNVNNEQLNNLLKNNTLFVGIFSDNCSYCINMKKEWEKFKSLIIKKNINGTILEINAKVLSSIHNSLITNNAKGFPSLFIISNNKFVTSYNSERTAQQFLQFFKKYIVNKNISKTRSLQASFHTLKKNKRFKKININFIKKSKKYNSKLKLGDNISLCKHAKNGINGCNICCSQFNKKKTYKRCIKKCMK